MKFREALKARAFELVETEVDIILEDDTTTEAELFNLVSTVGTIRRMIDIACDEYERGLANGNL